VVADDAVGVGTEVASRIAACFDGAGRVVVGCPAGRTPMPVYRAVTALDLDLSRLHLVLMDEFLDANGRAVAPATAHSCRGSIERALPNVMNVYAPDPAAPAAYEDLIDGLGGIDVFVLACGTTDGHVAFNPPGSALDSATRVVELAETTRRDNLATFPSFASLADVPTRGVTVGLGTIVRASRAVVLVAHGSEKAPAMQRTLAATAFDPGWPASVIHECASPSVVVDRAAMP
jgi:glucosamine-6-phosphate deaminase